jgi:hypothetical protein
MLNAKVLEKQEQAKPKTNRREIIKNRGQNQVNRNKNNPYKESTKQTVL